MRERPIPFNVAMVRAILGGDKTQTRRAVKLPHHNPLGQWEPTTVGGPGVRFSDGAPAPSQAAIWHTRTGDALLCPYGQPGDRLWVREPWRCTADLDKHSGNQMADLCLDAGYNAPWAPIQYEADGQRVNWRHTGIPPHEGPPRPGRYRHARFMPRWACRLVLEITRVRVERLQAINHVDAIAEGVGLNPAAADVTMTSPEGDPLPRVMFRALWEQINGSEAWAANPWVWVVEFRRVAGGGQ